MAQRADAQRNRSLLVAAAREVFTERGVDAPLDEIARRAGIGNATLYRHFPTRRDLIVAAYDDELTELCQHGSRLLTADPPGDALFTWLRTFIDHVATKRHLALAITDQDVLFDSWHTTMRNTVSALAERARAVGELGADVRDVDLLTAANGIALAAHDPSQVDRLLRLVRVGSR